MKKKALGRWSSVVACCVVVFVWLVAAGAPVHAQRTGASAGRAAADTAISRRPRDSVAMMWPLATIGAGAGLYAGAVLGAELGWGGGDDPGLESALLFAGVGSALGSALGALGASHHLAPGNAVASGVLGVLGGIAGATLMHGFYDDGGGPMFVGYSVSAGLVTSLAASLMETRD
jgi:hypothetical protein